MNGVTQIGSVRFLRKLRDQFRDEQPKLLVVGAPRRGFALLISVLNRLLLQHNRFRRDPLRHELCSFVPRASTKLYNAI